MSEFSPEEVVDEIVENLPVIILKAAGIVIVFVCFLIYYS